MDYVLYITALAGLYAIMAMSLDVVAGYTGVPAFGHAAFPLVGAYSSALLALRLGVPTPLAVLAAAAVAALAGALLGLPALRVRGDHLALATLSLGAVAQAAAENLELTRGPMGIAGIPPLSLLGLELKSAYGWAALVWLLVGGLYLVLRRSLTGGFGRCLVAIRDDELSVQVLGRSLAAGKTRAFALGATIAGFAGALYAHFAAYIEPRVFGVRFSVVLLLMVVCGGAGTLRGPLLGALFVTCVPEALRFTSIPSAYLGPLRQMLYGAALVLVVTLRPQGLLGQRRWG